MSQNIGSDGQSYLGYCGIAEEAAYGDGGTPSVFLPIISDGFSLDNGIITQSNTRSRARHKAVAGAFEDGGSLDLVAGPENGLGYILKGVMGTAAVSTSDPDGDSTQEVGTHTFTPGDSLPSYAVEIGLGNVVPVQHTGVGIDELELQHVGDDDYLTVSIDTPAKEPQLQNSQTTPTYSDLRPFVFHDATINIDGTDRTVDVADFTTTVANNIEPKRRGSRTPDKMHLDDDREVSGDMELDFETKELLEKFLGNTGATSPEDSLYRASLNATWVSPETIQDTTESFKLEVDIPDIRLSTHEAQTNESEAIAENIEWQAYWDANAGYDVQFTLTNGVTTAY